MKRILVSLLVLAPHLLLAQPRAADLEARLADADGRQRLELLVELVDAYRERDPARAVAHGGEAAELLRSLPYEEQELALAMALCDAHARLGQHQEALRLGERAVELAAADDRREARVRALWHLGNAHQGRGDLDSALSSFRGALRLAREIEESEGIADNLLAIGRLHLERGNLAGGAETLRRALAAATEAGSGDVLRDTHLALAEAYAALGRHQEAYGALRRYGELASAAAEERAAERAAELEARFELAQEGRDSEISALEQELAAQRQAVAAAERRRKDLARAALGGASAALLALALSLYSRRRLKARAARAAAEEKRRFDQALAELEQRAERDRTEIAELERRHAAAQARLADLERFTFTVSQDLKIPLIAIRGFMGSLGQYAQAGDVQRIREDARGIYNAVGKMARLLDKLLELLQVGRVVNEPEEISMSELAFQAIEQVGLVAKRRVEITIAPDMPAVFGDRARLLEAMRNLIENGVKFMGDQPAPHLDVGSRRQETAAGPSETVFYVRDNGIGIEARYHERVFDLFERLSAGSEGLGIGLALVRRIIEAHGGRVWVESEGAGRGATFSFTLPRNGPPASSSAP